MATDPGRIVLFPARPERWRSGCITGLRLRGAITLQSLSWILDQAQVTLVSDQDQTVDVQAPGQAAQTVCLGAGMPQTLWFPGPSSPRGAAHRHGDKLRGRSG